MLDEDLIVQEDELGERPSKVDGYAERLILAKAVQEAKQKHLEELIEQGERRKARFRLLVYLLIGLGLYYLHTIGAEGYIKEFFIKMSQTVQ